MVAVRAPSNLERPPPLLHGQEIWMSTTIRLPGVRTPLAMADPGLDVQRTTWTPRAGLRVNSQTPDPASDPPTGRGSRRPGDTQTVMNTAAISWGCCYSSMPGLGDVARLWREWERPQCLGLPGHIPSTRCASRPEPSGTRAVDPVSNGRGRWETALHTETGVGCSGGQRLLEAPRA